MSGYLQVDSPELPYIGREQDEDLSAMLHRATQYADSAADNCLDIRRWLGQQFPPTTVAWLALRWADVGAVEVSQPVSAENPYDHVKSEVLLPRAWRHRPVGAAFAIRMFRAVLTALDSMGEQLGLGPVPVKGGGHHRHLFELEDPFVPPSDTAANEDAADWARSAVESLPPGQLLVLARAGSARQQRATTRVVEALGSPVNTATRAADDKEIRTWTIQLRP
jgi:hypothetical protein